MWCRRSRPGPLDIQFQDQTLISKWKGWGRIQAAMKAHDGKHSGDYITVRGAGNKSVPSLVSRVRQAWLKLTTHRAFVTITCGLET